MTRTACLKQPSDRVPARVPRRSRSVRNSPARYSTVSSRMVNVAVYVTLIADAELSIKLICEGPTFIPRVCGAVLVQHKRHRRVARP
jgi:hypothetical protein